MRVSILQCIIKWFFFFHPMEKSNFQIIWDYGTRTLESLLQLLTYHGSNPYLLGCAWFWRSVLLSCDNWPWYQSNSLPEALYQTVSDNETLQCFIWFCSRRKNVTNNSWTSLYARSLIYSLPLFQGDPVGCGLPERSDEGNYCEETLIRLIQIREHEKMSVNIKFCESNHVGWQWALLRN